MSDFIEPIHMVNNENIASMKPIILIGSGRSGSTILTKILNSHPQIEFFGETDFLVGRLWNEIWENRFWFYWPFHAASGVNSAISRKDMETFLNLRRETDVDIDNESIDRGRDRAAHTIRQTIMTLFEVGKQKPDARAWGFKELWNGNQSFQYDWEPYDFVFPDAIWVHLTREPFKFAQSCSQWTKTPLNFPSLKNILSNWILTVNYSRTRKSTGRFFELKFEDLLRSPRDSLSPILNACHMGWDEHCVESLQNHVMQSQPEIIPPENTDLEFEQVQQLYKELSGFKEICESLGYYLDHGIRNYYRSYKTTVKISAQTAPFANRATHILVEERERELETLRKSVAEHQNQLETLRKTAAEYQNQLETLHRRAESSIFMIQRALSGPFTPEGDHGWTTVLSDLEPQADTLQFPSRSLLLLFEGETLLGPAHALHDDIRSLGSGRYSHWLSLLYFSASDNSDPNNNQRTYTILFLDPSRVEAPAKKQ